MFYVLFPYSDGIDDFFCPYEGVEGREPLKASSHHSDGAEGGFGEGSGTLHCSAWNHIQKTLLPLVSIIASPRQTHSDNTAPSQSADLIMFRRCSTVAVVNGIWITGILESIVSQYLLSTPFTQLLKTIELKC